MADQTKSQDDKLQKLDELLRDVKIAMFTTLDKKNNKLYSRPMALQGGLDDKKLYFFTYSESDKIDDIEQDRQVNCAFSHPDKEHYVSVTGQADTTFDRAKMEQKWDPTMKAWFPDGIDTKGICLIEVRVDDAQYWDSRSSTMLHLYGMAKAALTGEGVKDPGENEKVSVR